MFCKQELDQNSILMYIRYYIHVDADPSKRPTAKCLRKQFNKWYFNDLRNFIVTFANKLRMSLTRGNQLLQNTIKMLNLHTLRYTPSSLILKICPKNTDNNDL